MKPWLVILFSCLWLQASAQQSHQLVFDAPARVFEEAFLLGNGQTGATLYGGINRERIAWNDATLWTGQPTDSLANPGAAQHLPAIREALFAEDYPRADSLVRLLQGRFSQSYAPLGDLYFTFENHGIDTNVYSRKLDIQRAYSEVLVGTEDAGRRLEAWVSAPDSMAVIRIQALGTVPIEMDIQASSLLQSRTYANSPGQLVLSGKAPIHAEPSYRQGIPNPIVYSSESGTPFYLLADIRTIGGEVIPTDSSIRIQGAREVELRILIQTGFRGFHLFPEQDTSVLLANAQRRLQARSTLGYEALHEKQMRHHRMLYDRVSLELGSKTAFDSRSTPERLSMFSEDAEDLDLVALFFQYGRYLLISSSQTRGIPANLQGIWNTQLRPPWSSNYTTNINLEMNYWPVEVCNLSEMHEPGPSCPSLGISQKPDQKRLKEYTVLRVECCHHNSDVWAMTNAVGDFGKGHPVWANWNMERHLACYAFV
ncbi:MAG: glycoside hydrolase family 95 protein [Saprospiraceae bacterium]